MLLELIPYLVAVLSPYLVAGAWPIIYEQLTVISASVIVSQAEGADWPA